MESKNLIVYIQGKEHKGRLVAISEYAIEILSAVEISDYPLFCYQRKVNPSFYSFEKFLLNGCDCWQAYSEAGNSLIYDEDIAERIYSKQNLKRRLKAIKAGTARTDYIKLQADYLQRAKSWIVKWYDELDSLIRFEKVQFDEMDKEEWIENLKKKYPHHIAQILFEEIF